LIAKAAQDILLAQVTLLHSVFAASISGQQTLSSDGIADTSGQLLD